MLVAPPQGRLHDNSKRQIEFEGRVEQTISDSFHGSFGSFDVTKDHVRITFGNALSPVSSLSVSVDFCP